MQSATETIAVNQYQLGLFIPIETLIHVGTVGGEIQYQTQLTLFGSPNTLAMEFKADDRFDVLIGMDMLAACNLFIAHGEFFLSY